jgi:hypothetical protein
MCRHMISGAGAILGSTLSFNLSRTGSNISILVFRSRIAIACIHKLSIEHPSMPHLSCLSLRYRESQGIMRRPRTNIMRGALGLPIKAPLRRRQPSSVCVRRLHKSTHNTVSWQRYQSRYVDTPENASVTQLHIWPSQREMGFRDQA